MVSASDSQSDARVLYIRVRVPLWPLADFVLGRPEFKSPAMPVNSQLVASYQLGLNYFLLRATSIDPTQWVWINWLINWLNGSAWGALRLKRSFRPRSDTQVPHVPNYTICDRKDVRFHFNYIIPEWNFLPELQFHFDKKPEWTHAGMTCTGAKCRFSIMKKKYREIHAVGINSFQNGSHSSSMWIMGALFSGKSHTKFKLRLCLGEQGWRGFKSCLQRHM